MIEEQNADGGIKPGSPTELDMERARFICETVAKGNIQLEDHAPGSSEGTDIGMTGIAFMLTVIRAEERERCAKVAEKLADDWDARAAQSGHVSDETYEAFSATARAIAAAIRLP